MDLARPARSVVPTLAAEVLVALAGARRPLTGRQVASLAGGSQRGVASVLHHLEASGLVDVQPAGSALLYSLNREHVAADAVRSLVDLRGRLFRRISDRFGQWRHAPVAAAVFGSAARGDGDTASDIDLFVVRPQEIDESDADWSRDVAALRAAVLRWSGNPCSVVEVTPSQVRAMVERGEPVVDELRRDAVPLTDAAVLAIRGVTA